MLSIVLQIAALNVSSLRLNRITCKQALLLGKPLLVLGDLNCNLLKSSPDCKALNELIHELNLIQVINYPTRITKNSASLIDVILASSSKLINTHGVIQKSISDHLPVFAMINLKSPKPKPCFLTTRSFKRYDPVAFAQDMSAQENYMFYSVSSTDDVNEKLSYFNDVLISTLDMHAPVRSIKVKSRPCPFVTTEIKELMKTRDLLHHEFKLTRLPASWATYKHYRNLVKSTLRNAETTYF